MQIARVGRLLLMAAVLVATSTAVRSEGAGPPPGTADRADSSARAGDEARRRAEEAEARRRAEEDARRRAEADEQRRQQAEAEARRRAEEDARRRAVEAETRRKEAEAEARRLAETEAQRRAAEDADIRRRAEEDLRRLAAEAEARRKAGEEARRASEAEAQRREAEVRRAGCVAALAVTPRTTVIRFGLDGVTLPPEVRVRLDRVVRAAEACPKLVVTVDGHTDGSGPAGYNQLLSERRAAAVAGYLIAAGVEASRVTARGFGMTRKIAPNATAAGRALNRRIELTIDPGES